MLQPWKPEMRCSEGGKSKGEKEEGNGMNVEGLLPSDSFSLVVASG